MCPSGRNSTRPRVNRRQILRWALVWSVTVEQAEFRDCGHTQRERNAMTTTVASTVHDEAVAIVREAVDQFLPIARVQRIDMDTQQWEALMREIREVVQHTV